MTVDFPGRGFALHAQQNDFAIDGLGDVHRRVEGDGSFGSPIYDDEEAGHWACVLFSVFGGAAAASCLASEGRFLTCCSRRPDLCSWEEINLFLLVIGGRRQRPARGLGLQNDGANLDEAALRIDGWQINHYLRSVGVGVWHRRFFSSRTNCLYCLTFCRMRPEGRTS